MSHPISPDALRAFQERLGHTFADPDLLLRALSHRSWCAEHAAYASNERLEFLGDSVLGLVITEDLYRRFGEAEEGQLSRIRASVVCATTLAEMAGDLALGEVLLLGKGEAATGGRTRPSILADAMEAVFGAVYLDAGADTARALIRRLTADRIDPGGSLDHKSRLHELIAREHAGHLRYELTDDGPEHDKTFRAEVLLDGESLGVGVGRSKKLAEQAAAQQALDRLEHQGGPVPAEQESHG